jgi:hypothetical protein
MNNIYAFGVKDVNNVVIPDPLVVNDLVINNSITFANRNNYHISLIATTKSWSFNTANILNGVSTVQGTLTGYDSTTGIFTAPHTASYIIVFNTYDINVSTSSTYAINSIYFYNTVSNEQYGNASIYVPDSQIITGSYGPAMSCSWNGVLNSGDKIQFGFYSKSSILPFSCTSTFKVYITAIY